MRYPFLKVGFDGRSNFSKLLNDRGLLGLAVEIGTHRGEFASQFMETWKGETLYCVDPYLSNYDLVDPAALGNREEDFSHAKSVLEKFKNRIQFVKMNSEEASKCYEDGSLDFVYVDGNHQADYFESDIKLWWPKIKRGGILAGHDVIMKASDVNWGKNIQPVLFDFALEQGLDVFLVSDVHVWSFFVNKP